MLDSYLPRIVPIVFDEAANPELPDNFLGFCGPVFSGGEAFQIRFATLIEELCVKFRNVRRWEQRETVRNSRIAEDRINRVLRQDSRQRNVRHDLPRFGSLSLGNYGRRQADFENRLTPAPELALYKTGCVRETAPETAYSSGST
jgi:hypothetical protein